MLGWAILVYEITVVSTAPNLMQQLYEVLSYLLLTLHHESRVSFTGEQRRCDLESFVHTQRVLQ